MADIVGYVQHLRESFLSQLSSRLSRSESLVLICLLRRDRLW